jgi:L-lactate dehydrogenase complex protein LldE
VDHVGKTSFGAKLEGRAALHIGCHARREIHITTHVEKLMESILGLEVVPTVSDTWCCGFGGTFSVNFPEISVGMGRRKLDPLIAADVDYLISTDSSCLMHLGGILDREGKTRPKLMHVAEALTSGWGAS